MPQVKEYFHDVDLKANQLFNSRLHNVTTSARISIGSSLGPSSRGYMVYDTDLGFPFFWNGVNWGEASGRQIPKWGEIIGDIVDQTDLTTYLSGNYYPLSDNPAGYLTAIPSLDEVLTVDNSAYNDITFYAASNLNMNSGSVTFRYDSLTSTGFLSSLTTGYTDIRNWFLPDASGVIPLTVNNIAPDDFGNITISAGGGTWGSITGDVVDQTDLVDYLGFNYYPLSTNPAGYLTTVPIPTLQQVTDTGNITTNDIELLSDAEVIFGKGGGVLLNNGSRLREGTFIKDAIVIIDLSSLSGFFPCPSASMITTVIDPILGYRIISIVYSGSYNSLSDYITAINTDINTYNSSIGYTSTISGNTLIITARPGLGSIINGNECAIEYNLNGVVIPAPGYISYFFAGGESSLGIAQICSVGYELKWEAGSLYIMNNGGTTIREVRYTFGITPTITNDNTEGFYIGSRWVLDDGDVYICTDATTGNAVWELVNNTTGITSVTATSPLFSSGGTTPNITIQQASGSQDGYLSFTDWTTFNTKEPAISAGTTSQYWRGDKTWQTFPTIPTVTPSALTKVDDTNVTLTLGGSPSTALLAATSLTLGWTGTLADSRIASASIWNAKQSQLNGTGFVKASGTTISYDNSTYLTSAVTSVATAGLISGGTITNTGTISTSMTTGKLVGRYSSGTGVMEEISVGSGLTLTGAGVLNNTATPTPLGYYGAWQDNATQTAAASNTGYPMIFGTMDLENQVRVVTNGTNLTRITFDNTGIYNLQFSAQFQNTGNSLEDVTIWLRLMGSDVGGSSGFISVPARKSVSDYGHVVVSWNYLLSVSSGQYYELIWSTTNHSTVTMQYYAPGSPPPSAASVILTVTQQSGIMAGTGIARSVNTVSTNTAAGNGANVDYVYLVSGTTTITLPTAVGNTNRYTIKRSGTGVVSIATTSSQTIDGSSSAITINVQYVSIDLISNGTNWEII